MPFLAAIREEDGLTKWQKLCHRLQFQSMLPASFVFLSGGLKLAWSIFEYPSDEFDDYNADILIISWFIGCITGAVIGSMFVGRFTKNIAEILSGSLLVIGGILFIVLPYTFLAVTCSCILEGIAFALAQLQGFHTASEVAHKNIRGILMSSERVFLWFGILLQLSITFMWYEFTNGDTSPHIDQLHGLLVAFIGICVIILTLRHHMESPVLLARQQCNFAGFADVLKQLQTTQDLTSTEVMRMREDCLQYIQYDVQQGCCFSFRKWNLKSFIELAVLRCFVVLAISLPFNRVFLESSWIGFDCDANCMYTMAIAGLLGSLLGSLLVDKYGRRRMCVVTLMPATIFMLITGGIMDYLSEAKVAIMPFDLEVIASLLLLFQFLICIGVSITATVYLGEAFTACQKAKCMAGILIAENLLQLSLVVITFVIPWKSSALFFVMGFLCLALGLYVFLRMPETRHLTLYECLQKFHGVSI